MKSNILYLFTRTPLHLGAGSSVGAIDQPVQRERHTGFPIIPGSSIKGVMRDFFELQWGREHAHLANAFGDAASRENETGLSGSITFTEARLLLFPVRSAKGGYALATSPLALARYAREAGLKFAIPAEPKDMTCLNGSSIVFSDKQTVVLEEYGFKSEGAFPEDWADHLSKVLDDAVLQGGHNRFVLLSNGDLTHFALNACQINQHVRISDQTGTAEQGGLFNEEAVPAETLFFASVSSFIRKEEQKAACNEIKDTLKKERLLQFGGKNTTGLGFTTARLESVEEGGAA